MMLGEMLDHPRQRRTAIRLMCLECCGTERRDFVPGPDLLLRSLAPREAVSGRVQVVRTWRRRRGPERHAEDVRLRLVESITEALF